VTGILTIFAHEAVSAAETVHEAVQSAAPAHTESGGISALGLDPIAILAQTATFLLLFFIIKKFALSKIVDTLEKRRQTIDDGVRLGLELADQKEKLGVKVEEMLAEARLEADKIIASSEQEAGAIIKEAELQASAKADDMLAEARIRIDKDIDAARKGLEKEVVSLIAAATEKIIGEKLDAQKDAKLIEKVLGGVRN
jgi:F-type H+-transporting ATPase subunit b